MQDAYIDILISTIKEQYETEANYIEKVLGVSEEQWTGWKKGTAKITPEQTQKVKNLFSDYEWMLVQKVLRQTIIFPEKRTSAVADYRLMKTKIAQKWLKAGLADVAVADTDGDESSQLIDLRVTIDYAKWGFDDILSFRVPSIIQQQIASEKIPLLDWVNQNLADTYNN